MNTPRPALTWRPIITDICTRRRIASRDVLSCYRSPALVAARYELFWSLNRVHGAALSDIGRRLGYHHTTVMYGVRRWQEHLDGHRDRVTRFSWRDVA